MRRLAQQEASLKRSPLNVSTLDCIRNGCRDSTWLFGPSVAISAQKNHRIHKKATDNRGALF